MNRVTRTLLTAMAVAGFSAAGNDATADQTRATPYRIVATVGMVADIVRQVAGDKATVTGLIGEGVDPHLYKPTRNDIAALLGADAVFYSGLMLEGKMADALIRISRTGKPVYAVTELIEEQFLLEQPDSPGHPDPHVWMDVSAWSKCVEAVGRSLAEFDPSNAAYYRDNAAGYRAELEKLHAYARETVATIPAASRVLITAHDAFHYFGRAYHIGVKGIQGISTESEAGLQDINRLVDFIVQRDIKAVFVESSVSDKNVKALIEGARARGKTLMTGGTLFSDAMGAPGTYEGTYMGMMDHNITTIVRALGGQAPERGFRNKLKFPAPR